MNYNNSASPITLAENYQIDSTYLADLRLIWTPAHHDQMHRPFVATSDVDSFYDLTQGGVNLSPIQIARSASAFMQPSYQPGKVVNIANGFNSARYAFFLILVSPMFGAEAGNEQVEVVTGYTSSDYEDGGVAKAHWGGNVVNVSPVLRYHVNERMSFTRQTPIGSLHRPRVRLETPSMLIHNQGIHGSSIFSVRPEDVLYSEQTRLARNASFDSGRSITYIDTRDGALGTSVGAARNNIAGYYVSDLITAYVRSADPDETDDVLYSDYDARVSRTLQHLQQNGGAGMQVNKSVYYNTICSNSPYKSSMFTHQDLVDKFGARRMDDIIVHPRASDQLEPLDTNPWYGATDETCIAYQITHVMPYILMQQLVTELSVVITNRTLDDRPNVFLHPPKMMTEGFMTPQRMDWIEGQIQLFVVQGILEAMPHIGDYNVLLDFRLTTNSDISISVNGNQPYIFSAPMFCSSVCSPQVATNETQVNDIANAIVSMAELVTSTASPYSQRFEQNPTTNGFPSMVNGLTPQTQNPQDLLNNLLW